MNVYEWYEINVREAALQPQEKAEKIYKSGGLHKSFNKGGIPLLVKSSKSPQMKNMYTYNKTAPTWILSKRYM